MVAVLVALLGCETNNTITFEQCELDLTLSPASAAPGDVVEATGRPASDVFDTAVRIDGESAQVTEVDVQDACEACETCRTNAECGVCTTCDACADSCTECAPVVRFEVPDLPPGAVNIVVQNRFGTSYPLDFEVTAPPE